VVNLTVKMAFVVDQLRLPPTSPYTYPYM